MYTTLIIGICLTVIAIITILICIYKIRNVEIIDEITKNHNKELHKEEDDLVKNILILQEENKQLKKAIDEKKQQLENNENILYNSFNRYVQILENDYCNAEKEYDNLKSILQESYDKLQDKLLKEFSNKESEMTQEYEKIIKQIQAIENELNKLKETHAAAMEAQRRQEELKDKIAFHSLSVSPTDLADIEILETIKPKLAKPRVLSMLIWSTFFQKSMTTLCNNLLGATPKTGIYKITNQKNNMCYIGQAKNISDRWKEHAKFGLSIDTPPANKLYQAMIKDGIWNFTWELLEECDKDLLNEKERKYIDIYQANIYGYNSTIGNK